MLRFQQPLIYSNLCTASSSHFWCHFPSRTVWRKGLSWKKKNAYEKFIARSNSREAGLQAGSSTAFYNRIESTLSVALHDVIMARKGLIAVRQNFKLSTASNVTAVRNGS